MPRIPRLPVIVVTIAAAAGCPGRDALVEQVGGAPKQQLDDVKRRVHAAETKAEQNAAAAAAVHTTE